MTNHPSAATLSALADGELSAEQAAAARQHVDECLSCAVSLIDTWLLKASVAQSGHRYALPTAAQERLSKATAKEPSSSTAARPVSGHTRRNWIEVSGWIAAAAMLLILLGWSLVQFQAARRSAGEYAQLAAEAGDLHIAMLASSAPPQVISSDRHTVKPWFQGKLPFSFNLPETLPADTHLDGANLAYLNDQPVAQLLFSIGKHRASVFVEQKGNGDRPRANTTDHAGFHVIALGTGDLELIAVSDAEPARILALATALRNAQTQP